jgi:CheY-like chemotaxis protein
VRSLAILQSDRLPKRTFQEIAFDAVFSDVVMPGMGGMALGRVLRERFPNLQVILISGYSDVVAHDGDQGFQAAAQALFGSSTLAPRHRLTLRSRR